MSAIETTGLFFGSMHFCLGMGVPIAIALGGLAAFLIFLFWGPNALSMMVLKAFGASLSYSVLRYPLFVFMAALPGAVGDPPEIFIKTPMPGLGRLRRGGSPSEPS